MEQPFLDFDNLYQEYLGVNWKNVTDTELGEWNQKLATMSSLWDKLTEKQQNTFYFFDGLLPF